ncbi:MAG: phosphatidylserine decarboxylase, partial [Akkermansia sp.]|nr:phosphatidylserine decarboxylase [Akkermansia sp.]
VIHSDAVGDVLSLAVGATGVGAITQTYTPGQHVDKAQEQGYFAFGGSTVMTFFEPGRIQLAEDIAAYSAECVETYAHIGDVLGRIL